MSPGSTRSADMSILLSVGGFEGIYFLCKLLNLFLDALDVEVLADIIWESA